MKDLFRKIHCLCLNTFNGSFFKEKSVKLKNFECSKLEKLQGWNFLFRECTHLRVTLNMTKESISILC